MLDIRDHEFLRNFSEDERTVIVGGCKLINSPRGIEFITKDLHLLIDGYVALTNEENTYIENIVGPNGFIGNTKLSEPDTTATVRMLTNTRFLHVPHSTYLTMLENSVFRGIMIEKLSELQERTTRRLYLHAEDSATRIWEALISLFKDYGIMNKGELVLPFRLINRDLANYCGTTRETVNRVLKKFAKEKRIDMMTRRGGSQPRW